MIVCQVKKFELSSKAEDLMTAREYREANQWLSTWTIPNNIPMVMAESEAEAIAKLKVHCLKVLAPHKYPPKAFEFMVGFDKIGVDGSFYIPYNTRWDHFNVGE